MITLFFFIPSYSKLPISLFNNQNNECIMTDSMTKTNSLEEEVKLFLGSSLPPPNNLLCKLHPVEAFD